MTIKELLMPIEYFNVEEANSILTTSMFSFASLILIVSLLIEHVNQRDLFGPFKRFFVAVILCSSGLTLQNYLVNTSFTISDTFLNSLSNSSDLDMLNDPGAFLEKLSDQQILNNTKEVTENEEIGDTGVVAKVTSSNISYAGVIFDQLKNIPNMLVAITSFGLISFFLYGLQASYYILYFISGALFAIPVILSILPFFESSLTGALNTLGTLVITPLIVALISAMLATKIAEFGANQINPGESIQNVAILITLCMMIGSSVLLAAGVLVGTGISRNLGAIGALGTAAVMSAGLKFGGVAYGNKEKIASGLKGIGGALKGATGGVSNISKNIGSTIRGGVNSLSGGQGTVASMAKPIKAAIDKSENSKSSIDQKLTKAKDTLFNLSSPSHPIGRTKQILSSMASDPATFKKTKENMKAAKETGIKSVKPTGTVMPTSWQKQSPPESVRKGSAITKSHLLYPNEKGFKTDFKSKAQPLKKGPSNTTKGRFSDRSSNGYRGGNKKAPDLKSKAFKKTKKPYKPNNWEENFLDTYSKLDNPTPKQTKIKDNIERVINSGL